MNCQHVYISNLILEGYTYILYYILYYYYIILLLLLLYYYYIVIWYISFLPKQKRNVNTQLPVLIIMQVLPNCVFSLMDCWAVRLMCFWSSWLIIFLTHGIKVFWMFCIGYIWNWLFLTLCHGCLFTWIPYQVAISRGKMMWPLRCLTVIICFIVAIFLCPVFLVYFCTLCVYCFCLVFVFSVMCSCFVTVMFVCL